MANSTAYMSKTRRAIFNNTAFSLSIICALWLSTKIRGKDELKERGI
jgi:hypothetical protein